MEEMTFTELHCHTYYSVLDGHNSPYDLCERAHELGDPAISITDHGTLTGHRDMQRAAKDVGIKPILGVEAYLSPTDRFDRRDKASRTDGTYIFNHLIVLAKNEVGLRNLNTLSKIGWTEGFYHRPRIDKEVLTQHKDGLIVLSGCLNGVIAKAIETENEEQAFRWMDYFTDEFGKDFYIELQPDNPAHINQGLVQMAYRYGVKLVATNDCHFARPEDRAAEEIMLILSTSPTNTKASYEATKDLPIFERLNTIYPERPISFENLDLYVQTPELMRKKFAAQDINDEGLFENAVKIADEIEPYPYHKNLNLLPAPKTDPHKRLCELVQHGLKRRGLADKPEYQDRATEELDIIEQMGNSSYFLIEHDTVNWAKKNDILVGPGRGSASSSLVCYALGITEVDPIKYGLLFFRFINPERVSKPDIDLDFEDRRRGDVKEYLRRKFKNVAGISTFTKWDKKNVIKDVARVFNVPLGDVNMALKGVDAPPHLDFFEIFKKSEQGKEFIKKYPEVMEYATKLRGKIRAVGMHPGGIVISKEPLETYMPIETRSDPNKVSGRIEVIGLDMDETEAVGGEKLDILGITALSVVADTLRMIKERTGKVIELDKLDLDDPEIYKDLSNGDTVGVFQANEGAYTKLLKNIGVSEFEDLIATNALVRPGAANTVGKIYISRKHGKEPTKFVHPIMEEFTKNTHGVIIYQEQVMLACNKLAGMSMAEADYVRKIIGKKRDPREFDKLREKFVEGATNYISEDAARKLWGDFEAHADYSFGRGHSVGYSLLTYWTAWLKHYYPTEYIYASLKNDAENRTTYLLEAKRLGLKILLPHINKSEVDFILEDDAIRFGLESIKYIGDLTAKRIIDNRPYNSYKHFVEVVNNENSGLTKRIIQACNKVGAATFDDNPRTGDEKHNYFEFLGIPSFTAQEFPDEVMQVVRPLDEYSESETFIIIGQVTKIKRGKGWARVEVMDETATQGIFHNENTQIETGQKYFMLVANNRISRYIPVDDVYNGKDDPMVRWLYGLEIPQNKFYVVRFDKRKTKAGKMMGTLVLSNAERRLKDFVVFSNEFASVYGRAREGSFVVPTAQKLKDGGWCVKGVVND